MDELGEISKQIRDIEIKLEVERVLSDNIRKKLNIVFLLFIALIVIFSYTWFLIESWKCHII
jgi:hypothetical protein